MEFDVVAHASWLSRRMASLRLSALESAKRMRARHIQSAILFGRRPGTRVVNPAPAHYAIIARRYAKPCAASRLIAGMQNHLQKRIAKKH
jgi:hypothetical protein